MTTETKIGIAKFVAIVIVIVLIGMWFHSTFIAYDGWFQRTVRARDVVKAVEKAELLVSRAKKAAYEARFPKVGDRIEVNGVKIVILKRLFFKWNKTYKVRLPDGTISEVLKSELIDKKPIIEVAISLPEK